MDSLNLGMYAMFHTNAETLFMNIPGILLKIYIDVWMGQDIESIMYIDVWMCQDIESVMYIDVWMCQDIESVMYIDVWMCQDTEYTMHNNFKLS